MCFVFYCWNDSNHLVGLVCGSCDCSLLLIIDCASFDWRLSCCPYCCFASHPGPLSIFVVCNVIFSSLIHVYDHVCDIAFDIG